MSAWRCWTHSRRTARPWRGSSPACPSRWVGGRFVCYGPRANCLWRHLMIDSAPLQVETPSAIKMKSELEARLREIEDAVKIFSRKKVFIQG
mmetsp:Transcript_22845/g.71019  ORF Transcript_22845/g.71019 Transcript_22845/m.71019 type:complete len:92 (+) Transcript_22845:839-1114(+)